MTCMVIGKVVGSIVSTRKSENLIGNKFMVIEPLKEMKGGSERFVAINPNPQLQCVGSRNLQLGCLSYRSQDSHVLNGPQL